MDFDSIISYLHGISAIKWVAMILLTGFIAQFGKMFAEYLIRKAGKRKTAPHSTKPDVIKPEPAGPNGAIMQKNQIKADKKKGKTERKKLKKVSD